LQRNNCWDGETAIEFRF